MPEHVERDGGRCMNNSIAKSRNRNRGDNFSLKFPQEMEVSCWENYLAEIETLCLLPLRHHFLNFLSNIFFLQVIWRALVGIHPYFFSDPVEGLQERVEERPFGKENKFREVDMLQMALEGLLKPSSGSFTIETAPLRLSKLGESLLLDRLDNTWLASSITGSKCKERKICQNWE